MIKFRFHRGGLKESMATTIEVDNWAKLRDVIEDEYRMILNRIGYKYAAHDVRTQWDTYLVTADFMGLAQGMPVGWSNGALHEGYVIFGGENGQKITCLECNKTSFHAEDVKNKYCGNCKKFHDDEK